jgi:uncharacterized 2Fe-2S/4Fe-4S cluster protein (DUF4445 family)
MAGLVSPPSEDELSLLSPDELAAGVRLACSCRVLGAATVQTELADGVEAAVLQTGVMRAVERDRVDLPGARSAYGVAVDIGTTTVAAGLVDMRTGLEVAGGTAINPQTTAGHDVLTRVRHAADPARLQDLAEAIRGCVDALIEDVCLDVGASRKDVRDIVVAGNTAMTHLLLGTDVQGLGRAPYTPLDPAPAPIPALRLGWSAAPGAQVFCVPAVSAFVGGDIVAGLLAVGLPDGHDAAILVDMGTNGELVLSAGDRLWACSCAAGPAFEGMGISCGMRAAPGAIDEVSFEDDEFVVSTIGGRPAKGLCGSGVIDTTAALVTAGAVEPSGRFARNTDGRSWAPALRDGPRRVVLAQVHDTEVSFSQADVRQVQLAKGAIACGIHALLRESGRDADDISRLLVAGQFGHHVRTESLVTLGLIPLELRDRVEVVGNTSKSGAVMCLLSRRLRGDALTVANEVGHVELSTLPNFDRLLAAHMAFPERLAAG